MMRYTDILRKLKSTALTAILVCVSVGVTSGASDPGSSAGLVLQVPPTATISALGGAYTGVSGDINSLALNPGGIAAIKNREVQFTHTNYFEDIDYNYFSFILPLRNYPDYTIGFSAGVLDFGDFDKVLIGGGLQPNKVGTFGAEDRVFSLAAGYKFSEKVGIGLKADYLSSEIDDADADGFAISVGASVQVSTSVSYGVAVRNIALKDLRFDRVDEDLPLVVAGGLAYNSELDWADLLVSVDVEKPNDDDVNVKVGAAATFNEMVTLRFGYDSSQDADDGFSGGIGVKVSQFSFDYSYSPFGDLGDVHRFGLSSRF